MSGIYGALGLADTERVMLSRIGERVVFDAMNQVLAQHTADMAAAVSVFVAETTSEYKRRYMLPGSGYLQEVGDNSTPGASKAYGKWDVAFPLKNMADALSINDIAFAYMTTQELNRHVDTITVKDRNTVRKAMLDALFDNAQDTFIDPLWGSLSIEPLANGDTVTYPPVLGSVTEATDTHYLSSGYAVSAISDTNNPYATVADELEEHFGAVTGGSNIVAFIPAATVAKTRALTDFVAVTDMGIKPGDDTATVVGLPPNLPGRIIGRMDGSGVWVSEWRWIPATYLLAIHLDAPKPLIERVDPADTGLAQGLTLVAREPTFPFTTSYYRHRFGFGCGNRLNGVAMIVSAAGYSAPTVA
jgi:hypothetical protein